jgi:Flp pilus assembly protein TadD
MPEIGQTISHYRIEDAIKEFQEAFRLKQERTYPIAGLCIALAKAGRRDDALKALGELKELEKKRYVSLGSLVLAYIGLGDSDKALEYLEKSYKNRDHYMAALRNDQALPIYDPLRSDPRFKALLDKMKFPK